MLREFDVYIKGVKYFLIATNQENAADRAKIAVLQVIGGPDMVDLVEITGEVVLEVRAVITVIPAAAGNLAILAALAVPMDMFDQAVRKI